MARMIPAEVYAGCRSPGEREIFHRLKDDPETRDWIVLHSLDIASHVRNISGEVDFVAIIPATGVLCIEVKACTRLRREGGAWYYGSNPKPDYRGPFKQASEGMHSIREWLVKRRPDLSRVPFWSAVIFPYIPFDAKSDEWHPWQVIDSPAFRRRPIHTLLIEVLESARRFLRDQPGAAWFHPDAREPRLEQCESIAAMLRPEFEFLESPKQQAHARDEEVKRYTAEQFMALDAMETNPRVVFAGPAGTGKTSLALEAAWRGASSGRRVLLICFNRLLGRWLDDQAASLRPQVVTRTLHSHMRDVAGITMVGQGNRFWQAELPERALERLLEEPDEEHVFDEIIVDEAQDILKDSYLDFLDLSLRGGFASGRWRLFGDFEKQAIYNTGSLSLEDFLAVRGNHAPAYSLRINCRNTPRIAEFVHLLGGLAPGYSRILRPDNRLDPDLSYYADGEAQRHLLIASLEGLYAAGYKGEDIVILSTKSDETCCAATISTAPWKDRLRPFATRSAGQAGYCSIHAFKGMEAGAVIVTDIDRIMDVDAMALFYVAITRALHRLIVLVGEPVKRDVIKILKQPRLLQAIEGA